MCLSFCNLVFRLIFKAKEAYQARSQEAEKLRKDCNSTKDIPALEKVGQLELRIYDFISFKRRIRFNGPIVRPWNV